MKKVKHLTLERERKEMLRLIRDNKPISKWSEHRRHQFLRLFGGCMEEYMLEKRSGYTVNPPPDLELARDEARAWARFFIRMSKAENPVKFLEEDY
jgi:hypothetical protein